MLLSFSRVHPIILILTTAQEEEARRKRVEARLNASLEKPTRKEKKKTEVLKAVSGRFLPGDIRSEKAAKEKEKIEKREAEEAAIEKRRAEKRKKREEVSPDEIQPFSFKIIKRVLLIDNRYA